MEKVSDPPLPSYFHLKIHNFETQKSVPKLWIGRRRSTSGNWKSSLSVVILAPFEAFKIVLVSPKTLDEV